MLLVELYALSFKTGYRGEGERLLLVEVGAGVHAQASSATAEAIALRTKLAAVADLAV